MKFSHYILLTLIFSTTFNFNVKSQGVNCNNPDPFCTGTTATFPAGVNNGDAMTTDPGNNYGCLGSAPNPAWYYLEIDQSGNLTIQMNNSNNVDIDFILWGPYPNLTSATNDCGTIASGSSPASIIDCSYSASASETGTIPNAQNGEVYILLVTNFSNTATNISFTNTAGAATTNCSIVNPCTMTGITTNIGACDPNTNTYTTTGTVTFTDPPTTGSLIVQDCNGNQDVIPAPFTSPTNYTITNQSADGLPCSITAYFSADNTCTITSSTYNAPQCSCPVQITDTIYSNITCNGANDGSIQIIATNATQYSIDNGATWQASNTFTGLAPGTYQCVADDGTGCQDMVTVTLTEPTALSIPRTITNVTCFGGCDGSIVVAPQGGIQPYTYSWTNGNTSPTNINLCAGAYTLTLTDNNGCTLDSTFTITEPTDFSFTTSSVNANCGFADGSASVNNFSGGSPGYTYSWNNGGTGSSQNNLTPGNYSVTVTDAAGCDTTITITVGNNPGFTASISTFTDASCNGLCDGTAMTQGSDPSATYSFLWDNNAGSQTSATASNLCAGNYFCIVTDVNTGCQDTAFVTISEPTPVTVSVSNDTVICVGTSATISANATGGTPNYTYNWDNGYVGQNQTVNPAGNTTYTVIATDANGCTSPPNSVTISLYPVLNLTVSPDVSICPGDNATFSANVSGGNGGPYAYLWSNGSTSSTQNVFPTSTTTYYVTATDNCSPSVVDSVLVTVFPLPQVSFIADTFSGCEPLTVTFYNTTNNSVNPMWQFGDGSSGVGDTIIHVYQNNGTYDVQLTVSNTPTLGGCIDSLMQQSYITVYNTPVADFTFEPDTIDMLNPTVEFIDQSYSNIVYWEWNINNFDTLYSQNPTYVFPEDTGTYFISLYVENQYGCKDSITKLIRENGVYTIYIPNAFTPIDSKGINDYFRPYGSGISDEDYNFYIFDRWGELIYEGHSFTSDKGWDGTYKDIMVQLGVYVWKLEFKDINGKHHVLHGLVTIVK